MKAVISIAEVKEGEQMRVMTPDGETVILIHEKSMIVIDVEPEHVVVIERI